MRTTPASGDYASDSEVLRDGLRRQASIAFVIEPDRVVIHSILGKRQDMERLFGEVSDD